MADLIDRQKIKARFEPWLKVKGYSEGEINMLKAVLYEITIMPSAERKGHWMKKWHTVFKEELPCCSECNNFMAFRWDYCPNCGARMDGE